MTPNCNQLVGMTAQGERAGIDVYRFVEDGKRLVGSDYGSSVPTRDFPTIAADVVAGRLPLGRPDLGLIALAATAGAIGGVAGSPTPVGSRRLAMMWVSTTGISLIRRTG